MALQYPAVREMTLYLEVVTHIACACFIAHWCFMTIWSGRARDLKQERVSKTLTSAGLAT